MLQIAFLGLFLFLMSADQASIYIKQGNIKLVYFMMPLLWAWHPRAMLQIARDSIKKVPPLLAIGLVPLAFSVAFSFDKTASLIWCSWLAFDLFTLISVFCFLKVNRFSQDRIRDSVLLGLFLIALFGLTQYICAYFLDLPIFSPQLHRGFYRINGLSWEPCFLNVFVFLLLPLSLSFSEWRKWERPILFMVTFVLFQSTSKTGWALFMALGMTLFALRREVFLKKYVKFLIPTVLLFATLPTSQTKHLSFNGYEKLANFAKDLDPSENSSGDERLFNTIASLKVFASYPLLGVGPKGYKTYIANQFKVDFPGKSKWGVISNMNIWLELLNENGLLFVIFILSTLTFYLWPKFLESSNALIYGCWTSLILYYCVSGQFSQNILLTLVFTIWGIFLYSKHPAETL